jgi:hypothetical protein
VKIVVRNIGVNMGTTMSENTSELHIQEIGDTGEVLHEATSADGKIF